MPETDVGELDAELDADEFEANEPEVDELEADELEADRLKIPEFEMAEVGDSAFEIVGFDAPERDMAELGVAKPEVVTAGSVDTDSAGIRGPEFPVRFCVALAMGVCCPFSCGDCVDAAWSGERT